MGIGLRGNETTIINTHPSPTNKLQTWYAQVQQLIDLGHIPEPVALNAKESPAIYVIANNDVFSETCGGLIDGFTLTPA